MTCEREVRIENRNGLHARPAAEIVKAASRFRSEVTIRREDMEVNGKSIMGVMMLAAEYGSTLWLRANGDDAEQAVEALAALVASRFGKRTREQGSSWDFRVPGIVVGPVRLLRWEVPEVPHRIIDDDQIEAELARFRGAVERAVERLKQVRERAEQHAGSDEAGIFEVQIGMLADDALVKEVESYIRQNLDAEKAFDVVMLEWRQKFVRSAAPMLRERVGDLTDLHIRVLSMLMELPDHDPVDVPKGTNAILVTHDLTPSLTIQLDREAIAGIATDSGTRTSHVAILARSLGIPAVVGLRDATSRLRGGEWAVLDASSGLLVIDPSPNELEAFRSRADAQAASDAELARFTDVEAVTTDGVHLTLRANVDLPEDAEFAAKSGADGVGLMRTEFLVVGRATMPDEEEQYRAYRRVVEAFDGHPVIVRTFDIGGDKLPVGGYPTEANPFLGWRAIRMCLDSPDLFKVQLRALLRAAMHGDVRIMLPLIVTVDEVRAARQLLDEAAAELSAAGVPFRKQVPLGVMMETPAAAVAADTFAGDVAFFSIGTNDLVQYTLATDRGNVNLANRFTALHPAVLRLIKRIVDVGDAQGIDVAVCGEMASQPLMAFALIGLGVRELSVNPRSVSATKRLVRGISTALAVEAASAALAARTAPDAERELRFRLVAALGNAALSAEGN